jgi:hypothetical protein
MAKARRAPVRRNPAEALDAVSLLARIEDAILKQLEERVKQGDGRALLEAIDHFMRSGRVPLFFAHKWCDRTDPWFRNQIETLDEALGVQRPKGKHFDELKKRSGLRPSIILRVLHVKRPHPELPIGDEIFAIVANQLGLTTRYVRDTWYDKESKFLRALMRTAEKITLF